MREAKISLNISGINGQNTNEDVKDFNGFETDDLTDLTNTLFPKTQIMYLFKEAINNFLIFQSILDQRTP